MIKNLFKRFSFITLLILITITLTCCNNDNPIKPDVKVLYNISVNLNEDGEFSTTYSFKEYAGEKLEMPELPRVDKHECIGFYYDDDKLWDFENDVVSKDVELVARWIETVTDYEETIDLISKINVSDYATIKTARDKYETLSDNNKKFVDNYRNLYKAEIEYYNTALANADSYEKINDLFKLIENYPTDTLLKIGNAVKDIYNKMFELTYKDKINDVYNHENDVVKAVANAFLYKGVYNQYDQTRRVAGASPYAASEYDTLYLDCSAFCYSVYSYIYGAQHCVNLNTASNNTYAKSHQEAAEVIYYIDTTKYTTEKEQKALLQEIYNNLQVGDLINYRHGKSSGTAGHVVMYIGNGTIIHSTGDDMGASEYSSNPELFKEVQTTTEAAIGTVFTFEASQLFFDTTSYRYLFKKTTSDTVYEISVIRPLANDMTVSEQALSNYLLSDVDITKTSSVGARTSVINGEEVTLTVTLTNHSDQDINNIPIYKEITKHYDFISTSDEGLYIDGIGVMHSINLKANETKNITYKLKVKDDAIGNINDGSTYIHNITLPKINNTVVNEFDEVAFANKVQELLQNNTYTNTYDFINDAYKAIREEGISDIFDSNDKDTAFIDSTGYKVPDISKGTSVKRVLSRYLEPGDILSYYNQKTKVYTTYLYVKADQMICIKNGEYSIIETRSAVQALLDKMFAMSKYQLVRPTITQNSQK